MTDLIRPTRRAALGMGVAGFGAAGLGTAGLAAALAAPARAGTLPIGADLPFDDPVWNRTQAARLQAHLDGRQVWGRCSGTIRGVRPGEAVRHLFNFEVFSAIRVVLRPDGNYDRMSKEVVFYTDPATGEVLEHWDNPYTGERNRVVDIANDPYNWVIRDWVSPPALPGADLHNLPEPKGADRKPFRMNWSRFGPDTVLVHDGGDAYYPNRLDPAHWPRESSGKFVQATELFRYFIRLSDLANPRLDQLPHNGIWIRVTPWLPWMLMGDTVGHIMYEGEFSPNDTLDYFSPQVLARVRAKYPQFMEAPTRWYGPSLSSIEHYAQEQQPAPPKP